MIKKLSEYPLVPGGFNRVASALLTENNLEISSDEDFSRLFPDQVDNNNLTVEAFLNKISVLKNTDIFIDKLNHFPVNGNICIAADYDVDGIMACVIMYIGLYSLGYTNIHYMIPNRLTDGYGMQEENIINDIKTRRTQLVITVDNGITSKNLVEAIKAEGCDVIITDHHLPDENTIPNTVIIDPKYNNDEFSDICGAFVAFKLVYNLAKARNVPLQNINELIAYAGMATITDMMTMLSENRLIVDLTLNMLDESKTAYQSVLKNVISALGGNYFYRNTSSKATEELVSFNIGPNINAVSRVNGDVHYLVRDIINATLDPAYYMPSYIGYNISRREISNELFENFQLDESFTNSSVFIYDQNDYKEPIKGVLGLIANKISTVYNVVSLVGMTKNDSTVEFSGRSTGTYNLYDGIKRIAAEHPELNIRGGGHAQAMGIRLDNTESDIQNFKEYLEEDIKQNSVISDEVLFEFEPEMLDEIIDTFKAMMPFGIGFHTLKFVYTGKYFGYTPSAKLANIGDFSFQSFTTPEFKPNEMATVKFTINFSNKYKPIFNLV